MQSLASFRFVPLYQLIMACALPLLLVLAGCAETYNTHGQVLSEARIARIAVGMPQQDVLRLLGSPSAQSTFDQQRWYYITEKTLNEPLGPNQLQTRQVLILDFDEKLQVARVSRQDETAGRNLSPNTRVTPTQGESIGVVEQLLGNIGGGVRR